MATSRDAELAALVVGATALLPVVSEERRAQLRALLARLKAGTHGVGVGASFEATVDRIPRA
jgi:hypothetical protein